ncbi:MFS transporter [Stenotrophomonas sp. MMGLT7]|uniref:NTP/NDP exchange transporter n=1 Tax=Stenotrophomonas sp. MMGLT7 TaxID=2901227 RepID=UPI001E33C432|nr:MFS transporter [Stenotrophomonas sp. MMGLT7]MCD7100074.1 MFS transporter [Stenotrophomonas sp. MMGLT7]
MNAPSSRGGKAGGFRHTFSALGVDSPALWWSLLYFFCLLTGYYVLRPVRDAMGASSDVLAVFPAALVQWAGRTGISLGDFTLQVLFTGTFVCMVLLQPLYGALVSRFPRRVFLPVVYLAFIACLLAFYWMFDHDTPGRGAVFFIWVAVFNLFAVSVFWSYMADVFDNDTAKQVYGYIGAGGTIGALTGPLITRLLAERVGVGNLLLVSACFLGVCLLCILKLRRFALRREQRQLQPDGEQAMGGTVLAGLRLVWSDPLLRALAVLMFFGVGVGTLLYNEQAAIARRFFVEDEARTAYYANIDLAVNGLAIVVQLFLTRWLLRRFGIAPLLLLPALAILIGFSLLAASPFPLLVAVVQVMTRAGEFSLAKPARETLYTRVDRESRYKAKAVIDTVVYRGGDLTFVWVHKLLTALGSHLVFLAGVGVAAGMTFGAWRVIQTQRNLPEKGQEPVADGRAA